jgi:hypothetical protein
MLKSIIHIKINLIILKFHLLLNLILNNCIVIDAPILILHSFFFFFKTKNLFNNFNIYKKLNKKKNKRKKIKLKI